MEIAQTATMDTTQKPIQLSQDAIKRKTIALWTPNKGKPA